MLVDLLRTCTQRSGTRNRIGFVVTYSDNWGQVIGKNKSTVQRINIFNARIANGSCNR